MAVRSVRATALSAAGTRSEVGRAFVGLSGWFLSEGTQVRRGAAVCRIEDVNRGTERVVLIAAEACTLAGVA